MRGHEDVALLCDDEVNGGENGSSVPKGLELPGRGEIVLVVEVRKLVDQWSESGGAAKRLPAGPENVGATGSSECFEITGHL